MEPGYPLQSRDELWAVQVDLKSVAVRQTELSERLSRLERRMEDDSRLKSVWGSSPSFPGILNGNPQQETGYNPAAEAFKSFDQSTSLLGGLHIDAEEEPRRGASRANSVRFDESALHGHFGQNSRSSSEFFPVRTGSAFGSLPLTERSSSHKSDGRQSSAGQSAHSTHSTRLNSLRQENRSPGLSMTLPADPPPGLYILGPLPCIIRCWLNTKFSNESLLYAAVCSGSYKSIISTQVIQKLNCSDQITKNNGEQFISLRVYLPEATIQQPGHPSSPAPQVPSINVTFEIKDSFEDTEGISIILGSDLLRAKNADISFSRSRILVSDDERNRLDVPLVRPENNSSFKSLITINTSTNKTSHDVLPQTSSTTVNSASASLDAGSKSSAHSSPYAGVLTKPPRAVTDSSMVEQAAKPPLNRLDQRAKLLSKTPGSTLESHIASTKKLPNPIGQIEKDTLSAGEVNPNPWLQDNYQKKLSTFSSIASSPGPQKAIRGKSMKVLRPLKLGGSKASHSVHGSSSQIAPGASRTDPVTQLHTSAEPRLSGPVPLEFGEKGDSSPISEARSQSNPAGYNTAFGWLNTNKSL